MKNLLYASVTAPLLFIVTFLVEGFTRAGYSQWRHYVSQLATGPGGGVQVINFLVCGVLVIVASVGLRAALRGTRGSVGAPILLALFGLALLVAGTFSTDPALGYPVGAAQVHTVHGLIHGLAGLAAFTLLPAMAFVMAWHFARAHETRWVIYSAAVGALILTMFVAMNTTATMDQVGRWHNAPTGLLQRIAIIAGWTWISMISWHQLRAVQAAGPSSPRSGTPRSAPA